LANKTDEHVTLLSHACFLNKLYVNQFLIRVSFLSPFILSVFHSYVSIFSDFSCQDAVLKLYMSILFMYDMHIK